MTNDIRVLVSMTFVGIDQNTRKMKCEHRFEWKRAEDRDSLDCLNLGEDPICEYVDLDKSFDKYAFFKMKNSQIRHCRLALEIP